MILGKWKNSMGWNLLNLGETLKIHEVIKENKKKDKSIIQD
jgi:hypothetical protein